MVTRLILLYNYTFHSRYNTDWIANREIGLDPNNSVIKRLWCSFDGCQLTERTRNSIANDQREITPKIYKAELWFLCLTHRLIVLYNCM